jgi:hypothetical protein
MAFWSNLRMAVFPTKNDPYRVAGDPVVIVNSLGEVLHVDRANVWVRPQPDGKLALSMDLEGETDLPELTDAEEWDAPEMVGVRAWTGYVGLQRGKRPGVVYRGTDREGDPVDWYLGGAADEFLYQKEG